MSTTEIVPVGRRDVVALREVEEQVRDNFEAAKGAANTQRGYSSDWRCFTQWCERNGFPALPAKPPTVVLYIAHLSKTRKPATIARRLSSISQAHEIAGHDNPTRNKPVRKQMDGIKRRYADDHGAAQDCKAAVRTRDLRRMIEAAPDSLIGARDRALLLLGFAGALRRSELVALDIADLHFDDDGLTVKIRRSKTDQSGHGRTFPVVYGAHQPTCPIRTLQAWLKAAEIDDGPVFRSVNKHGQLGKHRLSDRTVARTVQRHAAAVGLDPAQYGGHSLRAGFVTEAASNGAEERDIMRTTGHKSVAVLRGYYREGQLFKNAAGASLGL